MRLHPWDADNRRLVGEVHPPDWLNPVPAARYHLVVVGAGTGGLVTAAIAAGLGARVALVERRFMGGDCLVTGCVPSKALLRSARAWTEARSASRRFGAPPTTGEGDFAAVMGRLRRLRADLAPADGAARFRDLGVDVFLGEDRFTALDALEVEGATLRFARAVVATGARPSAPPIPGLADVGYRTSETIFELESSPSRLAVVGGGPIGCELAQAFARLGSAVTLLEAGPRLLPRDDARAATIVRDALERDGVRVRLGADVGRVWRADGAIRLEIAGAGEPLAVDEILVATGRAPNVEGLGLDAAGVRTGPDGVVVDDRLRTSNPRIFAVGDVCTGLR
ncbi:MAG TPA: FAD-dependent oxidoreductase, partial [Gemmatimonadales bacterium]|nr:FAD-dependent oxidoreductase [Gemmatimonadales bacterium]